MKIVEVEKKHYRLTFDEVDIPGSGYAFPCDKDGQVLWDNLSYPEVVRERLAYCKAHPDRWTKESRDGLVKEVITWERYGICPCCGREVYFYGSGYIGAYECACGQWYNAFGQEIKPPDEWGDLEEGLL